LGFYTELEDMGMGSKETRKEVAFLGAPQIKYRGKKSYPGKRKGTEFPKMKRTRR